jgi:hypothetical protein
VRNITVPICRARAELEAQCLAHVRAHVAAKLPTGYDPARPETDGGAYILDMLKKWRNVGLFGTRIEAFVGVTEGAIREAEIEALSELLAGVMASLAELRAERELGGWWARMGRWWKR